MPTNIEIKARARDFTAQERAARELADGPPADLIQLDTFFHREGMRLKLREQSGIAAQLIFYRRGSESEPRSSRYRLIRVADSQGLKKTLQDRLGVMGVVRKQRRVYLAGSTRIHLDRVDGLGRFLELERVLAPGENEAAGRRDLDRIMTRMDIQETDLFGAAYIDLILEEDRV